MTARRLLDQTSILGGHDLGPLLVLRPVAQRRCAIGCPIEEVELMRELGRIPEDDYRRTFNLGIGLILAVPARGLGRAGRILHRLGESYIEIGSVVGRKRGRPGVEYR